MNKLLLACVIGSWLAAIGSAVHADAEKVDCSRVSEFSDNYDYYKDDKVKYKASSQTGLREYKCGKAACRGEPERDDAWKLVGQCKAD